MRQRADDFAEAGAEVAVITFYPPQETDRYRRELDLPFNCLADPARRIYALYGLGRGGLGAVFSAETWAAYARLVRGSARLRRPGRDIRQMGGDFVVAADGRIAFAHYSRTPADRPAIDAVLAACRPAPGPAGFSATQSP